MEASRRKDNPKDWRGKDKQAGKNQHGRGQQTEELADGQKKDIPQCRQTAEQQCSGDEGHARRTDGMEGGEEGGRYPCGDDCPVDPTSEPGAQQTDDCLCACHAQREEDAENQNQDGNVRPGRLPKGKELGLAGQQVKKGLGNGKARQHKDVQARRPACLPALAGFFLGRQVAFRFLAGHSIRCASRRLRADAR